MSDAWNFFFLSQVENESINQFDYMGKDPKALPCSVMSEIELDLKKSLVATNYEGYHRENNIHRPFQSLSKNLKKNNGICSIVHTYEGCPESFKTVFIKTKP